VRWTWAATSLHELRSTPIATTLLSLLKQPFYQVPEKLSPSNVAVPKPLGTSLA
jgi:hypothetical protein